MAADDAATPDVPEGDDPTVSRDGNGDLPEGAKKAIAAARKAERDAMRRAAEAEARAQEFEDRDKSESEKLIGERDRLKSEIDPLKSENLRLRIAIEKNLPADLVDRLQGGSEEELVADADKLLELFKPGATEPQPEHVPSFDGGARPDVTPPASPEQAHQSLIGALLSGREPT